MDRSLAREQALLERAPERRPVRVRSSEVRIPGIEVGVEVDERDRALVALRDPQEWQGDRVVTASASSRSARSSVVLAPASICSIASPMSNGFGARSPASATWWTYHGSTSRGAWYGRRSFEPARIAAGPNRAPGRYDTPESNGTPRIATPARSTSSSRGSRANVSGPTYRGRWRPSGAPMGSISGDGIGLQAAIGDCPENQRRDIDRPTGGGMNFNNVLIGSEDPARLAAYYTKLFGDPTMERWRLHDLAARHRRDQRRPAQRGEGPEREPRAAHPEHRDERRPGRLRPLARRRRDGRSRSRTPSTRRPAHGSPRSPTRTTTTSS